MPSRTDRLTMGALICLCISLEGCESSGSARAAVEFDVVEASITELQDALAAGEVTSVMLVDAYLARISAYDLNGPSLRAISRINHRARAEAEEHDSERAAGRVRGPMHGIPIIVKDNYDVRGMPTSGGTVALAGLVPPDDAHQVALLRTAGAIVLAKSSLHEFARGISTISSLTGQSRNPYDPLRNPGGSSGGTGAAIAASFAAVGWGSDTCGSIRIPASHNDLFGLRPTKGLSSIDGIFPLSHTQDTGGPLARTVMDLAIALDATVGADSADAATLGHDGLRGGTFVESLDVNALRGARLGVVDTLFGTGGASRRVNEVVRAAIDQMEALGAVVVDVTIPDLGVLTRTSGLINHEFSWDVIDYLESTPGAPVTSVEEIVASGLIHEDVMGTHTAPEARETTEYSEARDARDRLRAALLTVLDRNGLDALVYPTMRVEPTLIPNGQSGSNCGASAQSGLPALTIPAGFTENELPVAVELLGRAFDDQRLVSIAYAYEQATDHRRVPPTTPPLGANRAPDPVDLVVQLEADEGASIDGTVGEARVTFDLTTNELTYSVRVSGLEPDEVHAILIQESSDAGFGRVLIPLSGPERAAVEGATRLSAKHRALLDQGRAVLRVFTRANPLGALSGALLIPDRE